MLKLPVESESTEECAHTEPPPSSSFASFVCFAGRVAEITPMAMDLENPDFLTRTFIRRIDPAVFYWIFCCFRKVCLPILTFFKTLTSRSSKRC